jgi:tellurite resistance protein TehA-like permease
MNSGMLAIIMHQFPYQFDGLQQISSVIFMVDLVLFIIFSALLALRFVWVRRGTYGILVSNPMQLSMMSCPPIAWLTLVAFVSLNISQCYWGGHWAALLGYAMWWVGVVWMMATLLFILISAIRHSNIQSNRVPPSALIPAVGVATIAAIGGLISAQASDLSARLAVPVIIVSFMTIGVGLFFATVVYTFILLDIIVQGWPAREQIPTLFVLVGPMGQTASALLLNGSSASSYMNFSQYNRGTFLTATAATTVNTICVLLALFLAGVGVVMLAFALYATFEKGLRKGLTWNPQWNATVFPVATLVNALQLFAIAMDSPAFRVLTAIGLLILVLVYLMNLAFTLSYVLGGNKFTV